MSDEIREKPVSMGDIATVAGVSRMSVSCALRNQPGVGAAQRERILKIAAELGYVPDARINSWMGRVRDTKAKELIPIAWLNTDPESRDCWQTYPYLAPYFEGAAVRCRELGYRLEQLWTQQPGMTNRRISQILYQRGIRGVIVAPPDRVHLGRIRLNWRHFAAVTFEKGIWAPHLHQVAQDFYYNTMLALKYLRRYGYRRIGVMLTRSVDRRSYHAIQAAVGYFQSGIPQKERVMMLVMFDLRDRNRSSSDLAGWLRREHCDVVVGQHSQMREWVASAGYRIPEEIGVVHLAVEDDCLDWAGIWVHKREIGAGATDLVITLMQNNQFGLPTLSRDTLVRGKWHPGETLRVPKSSPTHEDVPDR
ncbi:LacI family transcriptional regulator [Opitutaceae bacterium TAV4]|nr:LacI family transcriptional regulator [Opitutaceae bacterium TAV4]RRK01923.1 LacI family transcriptional regulator [Opitutaceae bacterium TAV3]